MPDKNLAESSWKSFAKGKSYKDAALLKALGALEKAEKSGPPAQREALDEIEKQAGLLLKAHKGDKDLTAQLDSISKAAAKERKAADSTSNDDEAESPVLLTTKMVPLLRQVRQGEAMQVLIASAGKATAVLLSRRSIAPTRRKLMSDYLGVAGGVKFIVGECMFEENAHTFVVQSGAGGLAKKVKAALLAQTGMRMAVRVRGEDPNDVDQEGEEGDGNAAGDAAAAAQGAAAAPPAPAPAQLAAYQAQLAKLQPRVQQAAAAQSPQAAKYTALLDFAAGKASEDNHAAAVQALASLEKLLDAASTAPAAAAAATPAAAAPAAAAPPAAAPADGSAAFNARLGALMPRVKDAIAAGGDGAQAVRAKVAEAGAAARDKRFPAAQGLLDEAEGLLAGAAAAPTAPFDEAAFRRNWQPVKAAWDDALDTVNAQIGKLQTALRALNDPELTDIADNGLAGVTGNFKAPMVAALMDIDRAQGEALVKAARKGSRIAGAFQNYLNTEETVRVTDQNEFGVPVTLRASLGGALRGIESTLKAVA